MSDLGGQRPALSQLAAAAHEADLLAAIARRRAADSAGWRDQLLAVMVAAPLLAPAIEAMRFVRGLL